MFAKKKDFIINFVGNASFNGKLSDLHNFLSEHVEMVI